MFQFKDKFWKIIAVALVISVAYLAHGLHTLKAFPSLDAKIIHTAQSSEVININGNLLVTVTDEGNSIIFWDMGGIENGTPKVNNVAKHTYRN